MYVIFVTKMLKMSIISLLNAPFFKIIHSKLVIHVERIIGIRVYQGGINWYSYRYFINISVILQTICLQE